MNSNTSQPANEKNKRADIDLLAIVQDYKAHWWWFVVSVVLCCALAFLYSYRKNPVYKVQASVLIAQDDDSGSSMSKLLSFGGLFGGENSVDDEQLMMTSYSVMRETVKDLSLNRSYIVKTGFLKAEDRYLDAPVEMFCEPAIADTLTGGVIFKIVVNDKEKVSIEAKHAKKVIGEVENQNFPVTLSTPYGNFIFNKTDNFVKGEALKEVMVFNGYDAAAEALQERVNIFIPNKKANFINLDVEDVNVPRAKALLNTIVANYNKKGILDKQAKGYKTSEFIDGRLQLLAQDLDSSEAEIEKYKKENKISDVRAEASYLMGKRGAVETQLVKADTEYEILKITRDFIANPENQYSLIPVPNKGDDQSTSAPTAAIDAYNQLILERMKMENNARGNNAALKVMNEQLDALRANINTSLDKALEGARIRLSELRDKEAESMLKLGNIPTQERQFVGIKRQQTVKEQLYIYLLQQREEAAISIANSMSRGVVVDEAYALSQPVSMSGKKMLMVAFVLGLLIPVGLLYLRKITRNKFSTKEELTRLTPVPVLGEVCTSLRPETLIIKGSTSGAELFRLIRSNLQFILNGRYDKIILVTSTVSGEGKSYVSANLAGSFALLGKKVLLIGMDIRKPQLANYLNISHEPGLTQYLSSDKYTLDSITQHNAVMDNMDVIVAGPMPPNPAELLASARVDELFQILRDKYDFIIVDSAPVGMVSDTFVLDRVADATVYVCRANYSSLKDVDFMNTVYADKRLKKMSVVVNGTASRKGYGYGYGKREA